MTLYSKVPYLIWKMGFKAFIWTLKNAVDISGFLIKWPFTIFNDFPLVALSRKIFIEMQNLTTQHSTTCHKKSSSTNSLPISDAIDSAISQDKTTPGEIADSLPLQSTGQITQSADR